VAPRPDAELRLLSLAAAGAGASVFRGLAPHVPDRVEVLPIQLPGRETRRSEPFSTDAHAIAEAMAEAVEPLLDRPYAILGHSLGGLLGYELAVELSRFGQAPERLVVMATPAPHLPRTRPNVHDGDEQALRDYLTRMAGTPGPVLETRWLFDMYAPVLRADLQVFETYVHGKQEPLACPVTCWGGADDPHLGPAQLAPWAQHTRAGCDVELWDGHHFFWRGREDELGRRLGELLC
jgi:surfactin synthase thioesterase subunit